MLIIPAILVDTVEEARVEYNALRNVASLIQIDVMDGTMTAGRTCDLFDFVGEMPDMQKEIHLMTNNPIAYLQACAAVEATRVYFHPEPVESVHAVFAAMSEYNFARGLSVSPQTEIAQIAPYLDEVDAVQIMTVEPGEQGQAFLPTMLQKVQTLKQQYPSLWVAVDGGINATTIAVVRDAGVDAAGVGSAIVGAADPRVAYEHLVALARSNR